VTELINKSATAKRIHLGAEAGVERQCHQPEDALERSISGKPAAAKTEAAPKAAKGKKPRKAASGQREMLLPISGKRAAKAEEKPRRRNEGEGSRKEGG